MKTKKLILIFILIVNISFGQKVLNKDYRFADKELKVAIIPLYNEMATFSDSITNDIFNDTLSLKYLKIEKIRSELNNDTFEILKTIASKKYKRRDLKKYPNLKTLLSVSDFETLKKNLSNADLLLFPIKFTLKQSLGMTFGSSTFRFYDLNTGDFIHQYETQMNVNTMEEDYKKVIMALLYLEEKAYLINQKSE